jgi:hypothetical protein
MSWKKRVKLTKVDSAKVTDHEYLRLAEIAREYYTARILEAPTVSELVRSFTYHS